MKFQARFKLVYRLFTKNVEPRDEEVKIVMQVMEEAIHAQERDPYTAFTNRVRELKYGDAYIFRPIDISDLKKVDPSRACKYFNECFRDPSAFTVVIVGKLDPTVSLPLILQYLGGIPKPSDQTLCFSRDDLRGLPFKFPSTTTREVVRSPMVEAQCLVHLSFPVSLKNKFMMEETHLVGFLSKLLETKITQVLRFKHGPIYSVEVSVFLDADKPSRLGDVQGDISVNFSCDPNIASKLVYFALEEISYLQSHGPSIEEVSAILEIEQRAHENGLQENYYWLDRILGAYQSLTYAGDVSASFEIYDKGRNAVRNSLTPSTMQSALQRILPFPCKKLCTVVILKPRESCLKFMNSLFLRTVNGFSRDSEIVAGIAGAVILAISLWRYSRRTL